MDADIVSGYDIISEVAKESAKESEEIMKSSHKAMKKWYKEQGSTVSDLYGRFPIFWQDLKTWSHWSDVYKQYLCATQQVADESASDVKQNTVEVQKNDKERKSRWGDAANEKKRKRKSRWSEVCRKL